MTSVSQYVNRTVDVAAMAHYTKTAYGNRVNQELVSPRDSGSVVTGMLKLTQRFLLELFTDVGSLRYLPQRGTAFLAEGRAGFWRTAADVEQSFYASLLDLETNLVAEEFLDDPPDEKYASAAITSVNFQRDSVVVYLSLTSRAGVSREIIYPLNVNPLPL